MNDQSNTFVALAALAIAWIAIEQLAALMPLGSELITTPMRWIRQNLVVKPIKKYGRKYRREIICIIIIGIVLALMYVSSQQPVSPPYP